MDYREKISLRVKISRLVAAYRNYFRSKVSFEQTRFKEDARQVVRQNLFIALSGILLLISWIGLNLAAVELLIPQFDTGAPAYFIMAVFNVILAAGFVYYATYTKRMTLDSMERAMERVVDPPTINIADSDLPVDHRLQTEERLRALNFAKQELRSHVRNSMSIRHQFGAHPGVVLTGAFLAGALLRRRRQTRVSVVDARENEIQKAA